MQSADIGYAQIRYADAETAEAKQLIARDAVSDRFFIEKLQVDNAQFVRAAVSELVVRAADGDYYRLEVSPDGGVTPVAVALSQQEQERGASGRGTVIETDLTAAELSASNLKAVNALIDRLTAARLDVGTLFARSAAIDALNTADISSNAFIRAGIDSAVGAFVRLDDNGLHVGQRDSAGEVRIGADSVDVRVGGAAYSRLGADYVQFGGYQLRRSADGGLVFKLKE